MVDVFETIPERWVMAIKCEDLSLYGCSYKSKKSALRAARRVARELNLEIEKEPT